MIPVHTDSHSIPCDSLGHSAPLSFVLPPVPALPPVAPPHPQQPPFPGGPQLPPVQLSVPPPQPAAPAPAVPSQVLPPVVGQPAPAPAAASQKRARFFNNIAICCKLQPHEQRRPPMPISIDNGLPVINYHVGSARSDENMIGALYDTGGSLNSGFLPFHLLIACNHPEWVAELIFFDGDNPFDPVKLQGALTDPKDYDASRHGLLTGLIRYKTPYRDTNGGRVYLSFALGNEVSTNALIGWATIRPQRMIADFGKMEVTSPVIREVFKLRDDGANLGLPHGVVFDPAEFQRRYQANRVASLPLGTDSIENIPPMPKVGAIDDYSRGYLRRTVIAHEE